MGELPQGDDPYSQGFRDGCNTAIAIVGVGPMTSFYDSIYYDFDRLLDDSMYYRGKKMGFDYCTYYQDVDPL